MEITSLSLGVLVVFMILALVISFEIDTTKAEKFAIGIVIIFAVMLFFVSLFLTQLGACCTIT